MKGSWLARRGIGVLLICPQLRTVFGVKSLEASIEDDELVGKGVNQVIRVRGELPRRNQLVSAHPISTLKWPNPPLKYNYGNQPTLILTK